MLYDQVLGFADKARASGVAVRLLEGKDMVHLWIAHAPMFPSCQATIDEIGAFLRASLGAESRAVSASPAPAAS
jgi:acetyl esterase/lipase